ncbi:MAG TPA: hypothetical protein VJY33_10215 [Isosphaeraceae bacterium]|nr:hypothetical protein [Isosphaeraceae bacterium]
MNRIVLDPEIREKLHNLTEPLELCDEAGRVLAHLTPAISSSLNETTEPRISREELLRRKQNKGKTSTTAEVLAYLETL